MIALTVARPSKVTSFGDSMYTTPLSTTSLLKVGLVPAAMRILLKTSPEASVSVELSTMLVARGIKGAVLTTGKSGGSIPQWMWL